MRHHRERGQKKPPNPIVMCRNGRASRRNKNETYNEKKFINKDNIFNLNVWSIKPLRYLYPHSQSNILM